MPWHTCVRMFTYHMDRTANSNDNYHLLYLYIYGNIPPLMDLDINLPSACTAAVRIESSLTAVI